MVLLSRDHADVDPPPHWPDIQRGETRRNDVGPLDRACSVRAENTNGPHSSSARGFDACWRIFYHNASAR